MGMRKVSLFLQESDMKTVKVLFDRGNTSYSYMCLNNDVKVGDWALVMTPKDIPAVVEVIDVLEGAANNAKKAVIEILNQDSIIHDNEAVQTRSLAWVAAKKRLEEKLAAFQERKVYEMLAEEDSEAAVLIKQLDY